MYYGHKKVPFCRYILDYQIATPLTLSLLEVMNRQSTCFLLALRQYFKMFLLLVVTNWIFKYIFQEMLSSSKTACRVQAFDLVLNFGVHAHLLEAIIGDDASTIEEEYSQVRWTVGIWVITHLTMIFPRKV